MVDEAVDGLRQQLGGEFVLDGKSIRNLCFLSCPGLPGFPEITSRFTHLDRCFSRADE